MKKIFCILLFLLLASLILNAQMNDSLYSQKKKINIGLYFAPSYDYRIINYSGNSTTTKYAHFTNIISQGERSDYFMYKKSQEVPAIGWNSGIRGVLNITSHFAMTCGISFSQQGYNTKKIDTTYMIHWLGNANYNDTCNNCYQFFYRYYFASMP